MQTSIANIQELLNQCVEDVKKLETIQHDQKKYINTIENYDKKKFYLINLTIFNLLNNSDAKKVSMHNILISKNVITRIPVKNDSKINMLTYIRNGEIITESVLSTLTDSQIEEIYKHMKIKKDNIYRAFDQSVFFEFLRSTDSDCVHFKDFNIYKINSIKISSFFPDWRNNIYQGTSIDYKRITNILSKNQRKNKITKLKVILDRK